MRCNHDKKRLCPSCQVEFDSDPQGWLEYGLYPAGDANYRALLEEVRDRAEAKELYLWDGIPF